MPDVPIQVQAIAAWAWRILVIAAVVALAGYVVRELELVAIVVFVALAASAILLPLRRVFDRFLPRGVSTAVTLVITIVAIAAIFYGIGESVASQWSSITSSLTDGVDEARDWLRTGPLHLTSTQLNTYIDQGTTRLRTALSSNSSSLASGLAGTASTLTDVATGVFLSLLTTIFFLSDGERIWHWLVNLLPRRAHESVLEAGGLGWTALTGYVRGTAIIALVDAILIGTVIAIVGVPLALPLAVLVFFGAFIPIVGALLSGFVAVAVALATEGPVAAVIVLAGILVVQQVEGHVLQPLVMGHFVHIHPLAVVLSVAGGTLLAGIVGAVVAVPLVSVTGIVIGYYGHRSRLTNDRRYGRATGIADTDREVPASHGATANPQHEARRESGATADDPSVSD